MLCFEKKSAPNIPSDLQMSVSELMTCKGWVKIWSFIYICVSHDPVESIVVNSDDMPLINTACWCEIWICGRSADACIIETSAPVSIRNVV